MNRTEYALIALKEILARALAAVSEPVWASSTWEAQFCAMRREEQVEWLIKLFEELMGELQSS